MIRPALVAAAALSAVLAAAAPAALAQSGPDGSGDLKVASNDEYDAFVATADDRPLYMFSADTRATADAPAASACTDACAEAWPPLLAGDGAPTAGKGLDPALVGTVERRDGSRQVTYAGWPLYRYFRDERPAFDTHGQDLHTHGGEWYLLRPDGERIEGREL